jgi:hypothetical protein
MKSRSYALLLACAGSICAAQAQTPAAPAPATATASAAAAAPAAAPHVYGHIEHTRVDSGGPTIEIDALLNAAGDHTILHALNIKYASGEGGMYVHFTLDNGHVLPGKEVNLALPVLKDEHIKDRNGGTEHHPLVSMQFCIGDRSFTTDVMLEPITTFTPPLELSKADAAQFGAVDPAKKYTGDPSCPPPPKPAPAAPTS